MSSKGTAPDRKVTSGVAGTTDRSVPATPPAPCLNGAKIFGVRPNSPVLFTVAASGTPPVVFSARGLPPGLSLDRHTGRITGTMTVPGGHRVRLTARNAHGTVSGELRVVCGERYALTPPMGWNSWNCWGGTVSQEKVLEAARAMVDSGLQQHGWSYVNIDDGWQGKRGGPANAIQPNKKFPDMAGLADSIHALGLKFGIYSTPWRGTYEGHVGSTAGRADGRYPWIEAGDCNEFSRIGKKDKADWDRKRRRNWTYGRVSFVRADVESWARWGVDYVKYDWKPIDVAHTREMHECLQQCGRDVVLSLSNKAPFGSAKEWARLANCWRTTADIEDTWASVKAIGFNQDRWHAYAGPGHWNDPDMLVVGQVGWGPAVRPTRLTRDEQKSHFSLWCLLAAPLLIGCDLTKLDPFTLGLLTNDEVIAVDQDTLGEQGVRIAGDEKHHIVAKPLADGSMAVGLFNLQDRTAVVELHWDDLLITGPRQVRDLWLGVGEGTSEDRYQAPVPAHGVKLIRLSAPGGSGH